MTLQQLIDSDQVFISPADIAEILRCDPQCIRNQAHRDQSKLGYPTIIIGNRIRIPRIPFLRYLGLLE